MAASSRIFVKGLPPTFTDAEFRKHFAFSGREITDAKIFPSRRIGYIGYKTPEDAKKAVKYFNKSFVRMSRIGVEIARPVQPISAPTAGRETGGDGAEVSQAVDRSIDAGKRDDSKPDAEDPKLQEFLEAYKPKSKKRAWEAEGTGANATAIIQQDRPDKTAQKEAESDGEYQEVARKPKRAKKEHSPEETHPEAKPEPVATTVNPEPESLNGETQATAAGAGAGAVSDADWARSRTSRLLGLLDEDEEEAAALAHPAPAQTGPNLDSDDEPIKGATSTRLADAPESSLPSPPLEKTRDPVKPLATNAETELVHSSMRLFVRNLAYDVKQEDLEAEFSTFGDMDEVRCEALLHRLYFVSTR